jgi:hypothetical protein
MRVRTWEAVERPREAARLSTAALTVAGRGTWIWGPVVRLPGALAAFWFLRGAGMLGIRVQGFDESEVVNDGFEGHGEAAEVNQLLGAGGVFAVDDEPGAGAGAWVVIEVGNAVAVDEVGGFADGVRDEALGEHGFFPFGLVWLRPPRCGEGLR